MTMLLGTQVALFKVYGISSIASVLLSSGELTDETRINKRLADTAILIATFVSNPVPPRSSSDESNDPRAAIALARTNYLHGKYRINNDDFLYNLALFMLEPIRWTARFNWRPLTPTEIKAIFILWTDIGRHMGLHNLWSSYEEMEVWADNYEAANMVPSEASAKLARITTQHFLQRVPPKLGLQRLVFNVMLTVLDTRTRKAMQYAHYIPFQCRLY
ncbi:hypothetical protein VNI00_000240 [Paramarasmius palmivorus]|uniref:ER-bound oxygenase mpaB/mpaB'/Rubber oxygenase catalytic domain-containing protein n=1 Tax=Paramarasmius palmivorus TaxID=297713 RepID=A0AAW0EGB8_9AGAR